MEGFEWQYKDTDPVKRRESGGKEQLLMETLNMWREGWGTSKWGQSHDGEIGVGEWCTESVEEFIRMESRPSVVAACAWDTAPDWRRSSTGRVGEEEPREHKQNTCVKQIMAWEKVLQPSSPTFLDFQRVCVCVYLFKSPSLGISALITYTFFSSERCHVYLSISRSHQRHTYGDRFQNVFQKRWKGELLIVHVHHIRSVAI